MLSLTIHVKIVQPPARATGVIEDLWELFTPEQQADIRRQAEEKRAARIASEARNVAPRFP